MTTNMRGYQYLRPALMLSPSGKALTRLADDHVCIVRLWETPEETTYYYADIDMEDGEASEGYEVNLTELETAFAICGLSITPYQRIWIPLEWWQPQT